MTMKLKHRPPYAAMEGHIDKQPDDEIWVASKADVHVLSGKILAELSMRPYVDVVGIGVDPVNQAIKAIAIARAKIGADGSDLVMIPSFSTVVDANGLERTRMILRVIEIDV